MWAPEFALIVLLTAGVAAQQPLKTDVLFVGAHPDDDSTATATLARIALDLGGTVAVISATRGEGGGNAVGRQTGEALGRIREGEQRRALGQLGIHRVFYLDREDFGFTTSAEATAQLWGEHDTLERLVRSVRQLRPDVIVTMNPVPRGHGHHQLISRLATEAFWQAADPKIFPAQLAQESLQPWQPRKLYYALEYGAEGLEPTLTVDASHRSASRNQTYSELESAALRAYQSQGWDQNMPAQPAQESFILAASLVGPVPDRGMLDGVDAPYGLRVVPERFAPALGRVNPIRVQIHNWGAVPVSGTPQLSLRQGWRVSQAAEVTVPPGAMGEVSLGIQPRQETSPLPMQASFGNVTVPWISGAPETVRYEVRPSVPVARFQRWAESLGMQHLVRLVPPQIVVGQGETARVPVFLENRSAQPQFVKLRVADQLKRVNLPKRSKHQVEFLVPVALQARPGSRPLPMSFAEGATLAIVPSLKMPATTLIPHDRLWEGNSSGPDDLSATFRIQRDAQALRIRVDVRDDVVVSNLDAGDNQGHWRTDSVELCIDPVGPGRSEHTLTTYKLGIVPFNLQGRPMAARDADARPGPVHLPLSSRRTGTGYSVDCRIPLADLKLKPGAPFGLNVLIYDADRRAANPGENSNEARLAWSAWETVQGAPRLWGHAR